MQDEKRVQEVREKIRWFTRDFISSHESYKKIKLELGHRFRENGLWQRHVDIKDTVIVKLRHSKPRRLCMNCLSIYELKTNVHFKEFIKIQKKPESFSRVCSAVCNKEINNSIITEKAKRVLTLSYVNESIFSVLPLEIFIEIISYL